jgi:hypothetical protein
LLPFVFVPGTSMAHVAGRRPSRIVARYSPTRMPVVTRTTGQARTCGGIAFTTRHNPSGARSGTDTLGEADWLRTPSVLGIQGSSRLVDALIGVMCFATLRRKSMRWSAPALRSRRLGYDREYDRRRVLRAVVDDVVRHQRILLVVVVPPRVQISLEMREVAARDLDANAVAGEKSVARRQGAELHLVDLAGLHEHRAVPALAPSDALDGLVQGVCVTTRIDVQQLHCQISVLAVRREVERDLDRPRDLECLGQGRRGVHQNIGPHLDSGLIVRAGLLARRTSAPESADRR